MEGGGGGGEVFSGFVCSCIICLFALFVCFFFFVVVAFLKLYMMNLTCNLG